LRFATGRGMGESRGGWATREGSRCSADVASSYTMGVARRVAASSASSLVRVSRDAGGRASHLQGQNTNTKSDILRGTEKMTWRTVTLTANFFSQIFMEKRDSDNRG
jgi:hypothetical protein